MAKTRIGVKYCGGCNPHYERVELVRAVQRRVGDSFLFLRHEQEDLDRVIVVSGCPRACAAEGFDCQVIPYRSIMAQSDLPGLIEWLLASGQARENRNPRR